MTANAYHLVASLSALKAQAASIKDQILATEDAIVEALGFQRGEGSETFSGSQGSGYFKIILNQPVNRSVDSEAWVEARRAIPRAISSKIMRTKYELNLAEARPIMDEDPATWALIAKCVTSKPGKIQVEVREFVQGGV